MLIKSMEGKLLMLHSAHILMVPTNGAFPLHGTVQYGSLLGGFPLGKVPGTWYFF